MPEVRARLLGPPVFEVDGRPLPMGSGRVPALLGYLVATRQVHARERLASLLWPDVPERNALASLRTALYDARRLLGPAHELIFVERTRVGARADVPLWLDVAVVEAGGGDDAFDVARAEAAVQAYRGSFLDGIAVPDAPEFDDWLFVERERCQNLYLRAAWRLGRHYALAGAFDAAADQARRILAVDPLREEVHRALMRYLAEAGQRAAALAQYDQCRALLERELHIEPLAATTDLYERIRSNAPLGPVVDGPAALSRAAADRARGARRVGVPAPLVRPSGPLVGRAAERGALDDAWSRARTGHGGIVVLRGEAGLGKSRLAAELAADAEADAQLWIGRCYEATAQAPYAPIVEALRAGLGAEALAALPVDDVWLREIARLLPELTAFVPDGRNAPLDGLRDRDRLFEAVGAVVAAAAAAAPLLWIVEDVHWADETSLALLATLARALDGVGCLVVATVRDAEVPAELRPLLRTVERAARVVDLTALGAAETAALVQQLSGADAPPAHFGAQLARRTGGNPFFIVETLRALFEQGTLSAGADGLGWTTTAGAAEDDYADLPVPETVGHIVDARLERLGDDARALADAASVLRRDIDFEVVQRASGLPAPAALDALDALLVAGLWREADGAGMAARYDFTHALVRDRIYGRLSTARRQYLHRQIGGLIETGHADEPDRIAYHYLRGGVRDRACAWSLKAGDAALAVYAAESALAHFRTARQLAAGADELFAALSGAGHAFVALGRSREAVLTYNEALAQAPDAAARAELERCIGRAHERRGEFDAAIAAYLRARDHLRHQPATLAALRTADGLATVYVRLGRIDEAVAIGRDALTVLAVSTALAPAERDQAEAWLRNTLGMAHLHGDRYDEAHANLTRSLALKRALGDRLGEATVLNNLGVVHYHAGDDDAALARYGESLAIKQAIADHYGRAIALTNLALIETHLGRHTAAAARLDEADAAASAVGATWLVPEIRRVMAQRELAAGDVARAEAHAAEALAAAEQLGVPAFIGVAHRVLGQVKAVSESNASVAEEHFQTSLAVFEMLADQHERAKTDAAFGAALMQLGRSADATVHLQRAYDTFRRAGAAGRAERVARLLAGD